MRSVGQGGALARSVATPVRDCANVAATGQASGSQLMQNCRSAITVTVEQMRRKRNTHWSSSTEPGHASEINMDHAPAHVTNPRRSPGVVVSYPND